jgi:DNA-binding response OmpR family regulator
VTTLKVLVVEDEWLIGEELKDQLEELGHEVMGPALNCAAALELAFRTRPDLAVVDTHLGSETCEAVLDEMAAQDVPVLICSGHSQHELPDFARGFPLLTKPFDRQAVQSALSTRVRDPV